MYLNRERITLKTNRLILRGWNLNDADSMYRYAKDKDVGPIAGWPAHDSIATSRIVIWELIKHPYCFAICKREDIDHPIGCIELKTKTDMSDNPLEYELGYWLGKPYWGNGYMTEAAEAILDFGFKSLHLAAIWAGYYDGNIKSKRVQEKLGFAYHHTCKRVEVPLLHEVRIGHSNVISFARWVELHIKDRKEISLSLEDKEWEMEFIDHDRAIARAIAFDKDLNFYFVHIARDDEFGKASYIETSGGGVENEDFTTAVQRELKEELGAFIKVILKIGVVSDYYNKIHRHNITHYYLCSIESFGNRKLTSDEENKWHLSTVKMSMDEAIEEYKKNRDTKIGRIVSNRELPILERVKEILKDVL